MSENTELFLRRVRGYYEETMNEMVDDKSRKREQVEHRVALANALRPYGTLKDIGKALGNKDHATISHSLETHDVHYRYSPSYINKYNVALEATQYMAKAYGRYPRNTGKKAKESALRDVQMIELTIINLEKLLKTYEERLEKSWKREKNSVDLHISSSNKKLYEGSVPRSK